MAKHDVGYKNLPRKKFECFLNSNNLSDSFRNKYLEKTFNYDSTN